MALSEEPHVPASRLDPEDGAPKWQQINRLFERCGYDAPNNKLRDELVVHLMWARLGEALNAARSEPDERVKGLVEALEWGVRLGDVVLKSWTPQDGPHAIRLSDGTLLHGEAADTIAAVCEAITEFAGHAREALSTYQDKPSE